MLKNIVIGFIFMFGHTAFAQQSSLLKELMEAEINSLERGEMVVKTKEMPDSSWPQITIYTLVESSPLEAMGIFSALDYQKNFVPNMIKSNPIKHLSPTEVLTEYEMHVPFPLSNAIYTHGSIVHQFDKDYELTWYMVASSSTDKVQGSAYFSPYKKGTLFRYTSYIKPKSIFGALVKKIMMKDVRAAVMSIRQHIEKLKKENSPLLYKYTDFINRSLKGEFVYKDALIAK